MSLIRRNGHEHSRIPGVHYDETEEAGHSYGDRLREEAARAAREDEDQARRLREEEREVVARQPVRRLPERDAPFLFRWRRAFSSPSGPHSTARLVLWALSAYMDEQGAGAFPSQQRLALDAGLSLRCVRDQLAAAQEAGWIRRKEISRPNALWVGHAYEPAIPEEALSAAANGAGAAGAAAGRSAAPAARSVAPANGAAGEEGRASDCIKELNKNSGAQRRAEGAAAPERRSLIKRRAIPTR